MFVLQRIAVYKYAAFCSLDNEKDTVKNELKDSVQEAILVHVFLLRLFISPVLSIYVWDILCVHI